MTTRAHPDLIAIFVGSRKKGATPASVAKHFEIDVRHACKMLRQLVLAGDLVERMENRVIVFHAKEKGIANA